MQQDHLFVDSLLELEYLSFIVLVGSVWKGKTRGGERKSECSVGVQVYGISKITDSFIIHEKLMMEVNWTMIMMMMRRRRRKRIMKMVMMVW